MSYGFSLPAISYVACHSISGISCVTLTSLMLHSHRIPVWYIYLHWMFMANVGVYVSIYNGF